MTTPRTAALATVLLAAACENPIQVYCDELGANALPLRMTATAREPGCPELGTLTMESNRTTACGDGCGCALDNFVTDASVDEHGVFGRTTYYSCSAHVARTCSGAGSLTCGELSIRQNYDDANAPHGYELVAGCKLAENPACTYTLTGSLE